MIKKLLFVLVTFVLLLSFAQSAKAAAVAIGDPNAANLWSTTSAVSVTSNNDAGAWSSFPVASLVNGAGLDAATGLLHGNLLWSGGSWLVSGPAETTSPSGQTCKVWIEFTFDQTYDVGSLWVWNYQSYYQNNAALKDVTIDYSTDGSTWTELGDYVFKQQGAYSGGAHSDEIPFGVKAKHVVISATTNYGQATYWGLSEARFYLMPFEATVPGPADKATMISLTPVLSWLQGSSPQSINGHRVYFGTDFADINSATTGYVERSEPNYAPAGLEFGKTYY